MRYILFFLLFTISITYVQAQKCVHKDLGRQIVVITQSKRFKTADSDSCVVKILIKDKQTNKLIQQIDMQSSLLFSTSFCHCNNVRSYITGKNLKREVSDNDYGDLIVADFNFDKREDIAFISDYGGNGGPNYTFYVQDAKGHFHVDHFLTDTVSFFPVRINKEKRTVATVSHADVGHVYENVYRYNKNSGKWQRVRGRILED